MKRSLYVVTLVMLSALPLFAFEPQAQGQRPAAQRPAVQARQDQLKQIRQRISQVYVNQFKTEVELTDDQFLKLNPMILRFIDMRFQLANQRDQLNRQRDQLLGQPSPSDEDVKTLTDEQAKLENRAANSELRFVEAIRMELTARQVLLISPFNRRFFSETLPGLIEKARAMTPAGGSRPALRPNQNRGKNNPSAPIETFQKR